MTLPRVVRYLQQGKTLEELEREHGVVAREYNGKVSLCYHQLDASPDDMLARQCRGLILRKDTWDVLAYPFDRFFNHGQCQCDDIDWTTAEVQEKLDGTLVILYYDDGRWHAATRKSPEAATVSQAGITYREMADRTLQVAGWTSLEHFMKSKPTGYTYMFELTAPENQVVCQYREARMWFLGMRDMHTFKETSPPIYLDAAMMPAKYDATDVDAVLRLVDSRDPLRHEGVVVVDAAFRRMKIKSDAYVALHSDMSRSNLIAWNWRMIAPWTGIVAIILEGKDDDVEAKASDTVRQQLAEARRALHELFADTWEAYKSIEHLDDMKVFSRSASQYKWPDALFKLKRSGQPPELTAKATRPAKMVRMCGLDNNRGAT